MFPILYDSVTIGSVPQHFGLGVLSDAISCIVEEERNGIYELTMEYSATGIHAEELAQRRIIKVKPNFTDPPQLFRIDRIGKTMNGKFTVYAKHISYDISSYAILSGEANNIVSACELLTEATQLDAEHHPDEKFTIETSKTTAGIFTIKEPSSVRSWFGGKEGSLLDVYGGGEWHYNNFYCKLWEHRGVEEARETIRYAKNLLELSQEMDSSNLYTDVICFYKNDTGVMVASEKRSTGLSLDVPKVLVVDVSSDFDTEPSTEMLNEAADTYIGSHNLTVPSNNITLDFVQSGELTGRVDLCDKVKVYYEAFGINAEFKCIRTKWDCLREKYIETEFGDAKQSLADTISQTTSTVDTIAGIAGDKKRVFVNQPVPPYDVGDLWVNDGTIYYCIEGKKETIIKEAEGDIITFDTLQKSNLLECKAGINYLQDLHGYTKPWAAGTGKNLFNISNISASGAIAGLNYTRTDTGVSWSGTATNTGWQVIYDITFNETGTYHYKAESVTSERLLRGWTNISNNSSFDFEVTDTSIVYRLALAATTAGQSYSGNIKNIIISKGAGEQAYEPYSNVCEITGFEEANISRKGKNLLKNTLEDYHRGNVYWTVNEDKSISLSGTASSTVFIPLADSYYLPDGEFTMSKSGYAGIQVLLRAGTISGADVFWNTDLNDRTATLSAGDYFPLIRIASGTNTDNITIYPQMEAGETSTDYLPYECEIFDVDIRINKGINVWDEDWELGWLSSSDGSPTDSTTAIRSKDFCPILPNTTYFAYLSPAPSIYVYAVYFYDADKVFTHRQYTSGTTFTTQANDRYFKIATNTDGSYGGTSYNHNISINSPASDHQYHSHNGDPVYKGELNVATGKLKVTHYCIDLGDVSWTQTSIYQSRKAFYTELLGNMKPATASNTKIDAVCEQYDLKTGDAVYIGQEGFSGWSTQKRIAVYDSTKESLSAADFQTAMQGIKLVYELADPITVNVDANDIETLFFNNMWTDTNSSIYVKYMYIGFASDDWQLATDFVDEANLEDSIRNATEIITGATGGNVVINYKDVSVDGVITKRPYEILILCDADNIDDATQIWRWNAGGLGYSNTGYDGKYDTAISVDLQTGKGYINADFITAGVLDASLVTIRDLTATMFTGNTIILGGSDNSKLEVQDTSGNPLIRINRTGMECFGSTVNNITPSVVFDKDGVTGYSNSDPAAKPTSKIFWTNKDSFQMKNAVIENEASFGGKIKFVPITVGNFEGIAVVPVI